MTDDVYKSDYFMFLHLGENNVQFTFKLYFNMDSLRVLNGSPFKINTMGSAPRR